jgi:hypothetical protein
VWLGCLLGRFGTPLDERLRAAINNLESDGLVCCADHLRCTGAGNKAGY